jgi:hypothetical protein
MEGDRVTRTGMMGGLREESTLASQTRYGIGRTSPLLDPRGQCKSSIGPVPNWTRGTTPASRRAKGAPERLVAKAEEGRWQKPGR